VTLWYKRVLAYVDTDIPCMHAIVVVIYDQHIISGMCALRSRADGINTI
jgi:hypothetical protein